MKISILLRTRLAAVYFLGIVYCVATPAITSANDDPGWVAKANNAFALDLYGKLAAGEHGNLFFSPNSIESALTMTYAGARGKTAAQMAAVLHLPPGSDAIHKDFGAFLGRLNGEPGQPRGYELSVANALWGQTGFDFLPAFVDVLKTDYGAGLAEVDYKRNAEGARQAINGWISKQTHDKITNLIGPGVLNATTRLVLTNAIYFKGNWAVPFNKNATHDEPFHLSANEESKVPMMHRTGEYGYMEAADFQALKLGYAGNQLSMIVLLPRRIDGLPQLETELSTSNLSDWFGKFFQKQVAVALPKFRMTQSFELAPTLGSMGMQDAFNPVTADFSGMTGTKDLFISNVIHKAFVAVDEQGTEAAAATGVVMAARAMMPSPPTVFRADHPFLFLIKDDQSGAILFLGRLAAPE
jgi:serpin B